jgi:hypothetical protein
MHSACVSGTDVYAEHMSHELVHALNAQHAKHTDAYPEHTHQELMRSLSIHVMN